MTIPQRDFRKTQNVKPDFTIPRKIKQKQRNDDFLSLLLLLFDESQYGIKLAQFEKTQLLHEISEVKMRLYVEKTDRKKLKFTQS